MGETVDPAAAEEESGLVPAEAKGIVTPPAAVAGEVQAAVEEVAIPVAQRTERLPSTDSVGALSYLNGDGQGSPPTPTSCRIGSALSVDISVNDVVDAQGIDGTWRQARVVGTAGADGFVIAWIDGNQDYSSSTTTRLPHEVRQRQTLSPSKAGTRVSHMASPSAFTASYAGLAAAG